MSAPLDLLGQRFGRLLVVERAPSDKWGGRRWVCLCECGNTTTASASNLRGGHVRSCKCIESSQSYARPRFLLAVCRNLKWTDAGIFVSEREAACAAAQETGDTQIILLRTSEDPQLVIASLKRALVIALHEGPDRRLLLVGFYFEPPHPTNPLINMHRQPMFARTTDADMVVKFQTVSEAHACLKDVKPFAPDVAIRVMDWREPVSASPHAQPLE
jgi:hypothetical protein